MNTGPSNQQTQQSLKPCRLCIKNRVVKRESDGVRWSSGAGIEKLSRGAPALEQQLPSAEQTVGGSIHDPQSVGTKTGSWISESSSLNSHSCILKTSNLNRFHQSASSDEREEGAMGGIWLWKNYCEATASLSELGRTRGISLLQTGKSLLKHCGDTQKSPQRW